MNLLHRSLLTAMLVASLVPCQQATAQESSSFVNIIREFGLYVDQKLKRGEIVGLSVAFEKDGYFWSGGYGYADLEDSIPATAESSYPVASVTKPMTAAGVLMLAEHGKVDLDAEVQAYVPYFPRKAWPVTVRQILGHISGISNHRADPEYDQNRRLSTSDAIALFRNQDLDFRPGTAYEYSTPGYNLLAAVIEGASGQTYADFMRDNVWHTLNMSDTRVDGPLDSLSDNVRGYRIVDGRIARSPIINTSIDVGGSGIRSTVGDMVRFAQGLSDSRLINDTLCSQMWTSMTTADLRYTGYGMGWSIGTFNGRFAVLHDGATEGTCALLIHFPVHDLTVAVACNLETADPYAFAIRLIELLLGERITVPPTYAGDQKDALRLQALTSCFQQGMSYFDRHRSPVTTDSAQLARAFAYLNKSLQPAAKKVTPVGIRAMVNNGGQPLSGDAFAKTGSFAIFKLTEARGPAYVEKAYGAGSLSLFADYISLCNEQPGELAPYRLDKRLEKKIIQWDSDWSSFQDSDHLSLIVTGATDPDSLCDGLRKVFKGHKIYPDFSAELAGAARASIVAGEQAKALRFAGAAVELYPGSDYALTFLGVLNIVAGNVHDGRKLILRAAEINPVGDAGHLGLNAYAYQLAGIGMLDEAVEVLKVAVELHPQVANLYDSMGEMYLSRGDTVQALALYEKALRVDPNFENARIVLRKFRKPSE